MGSWEVQVQVVEKIPRGYLCNTLCAKKQWFCQGHLSTQGIKLG
jgi:hypothetical protein